MYIRLWLLTGWTLTLLMSPRPAPGSSSLLEIFFTLSLLILPVIHWLWFYSHLTMWSNQLEHWPSIRKIRSLNLSQLEPMTCKIDTCHYLDWHFNASTPKGFIGIYSCVSMHLHFQSIQDTWMRMRIFNQIRECECMATSLKEAPNYMATEPIRWHNSTGNANT